MTLEASPYFNRKLKKISKHNQRLTKDINQQLKRLIQNNQHPSLKLHKLEGKQEQWSIRIQADIRIIFQHTKTGILLTDIGTHDEVY